MNGLGEFESEFFIFVFDWLKKLLFDFDLFFYLRGGFVQFGDFFEGFLVPYL